MGTREVRQRDESGNEVVIVYRRSAAERAAARLSRTQAQQRGEAVAASMRTPSARRATRARQPLARATIEWIKGAGRKRAELSDDFGGSK